ncbi:MAG: RNA ligase (ATP) [Deltaproteobacteria bacterium]|nr:RNA ligase (ATP) [Deltaproteobacteria bacterium]
MARKLARIVRVDAIRPIEGADAIEAAVVGGWVVVVKKGDFTPGALAVYFEIDSFLPEGNASWQFLVDKQPRVFEGRRGHVLRTLKLRGQVSQGLLLGLGALDGTDLDRASLAPGDEVTLALGVQKFEPPVPAELGGVARGAFPSGVPRTDQERIQNLAEALAEWQALGDSGALHWEVTEKLEGTSITFALLEGALHVCSRNLDLVERPESTPWRLARALDLEAKLLALEPGRSLAIQGELVGHGIQGNPYALQAQRFFVFDVWDLDRASYLGPDARRDLCARLGIEHVPVLDPRATLGRESTMEALLARADGESALRKGQPREGVVWKALERVASWKAVSNRYLLKHGG